MKIVAKFYQETVSVLAFITILCVGSLLGQKNDSIKVVQFSGRVISLEDNKLQRLIYTNIAVKGTPRGTNSDIDGFFSLAVREGETVIFSNLGYETTEFRIPSDIKGNLYSKDILMKKDTLFLPEAMIYPWPDKDFFKIEFLALEVNNPLEDIVAENLSQERLAILREILPVDGGEVSKVELRQAAQANYSNGQIKPQNIFNPLSWKKFIDAIKRGDFKKKDK
jgi:hypothetical protein